MQKVKWLFVPVLAILLGATLFAACGGGGDSAAPCAAPTVDVNGTWRITSTVQTDGCGDSTSGTFDTYISQSGSTASSSDISLTGKVCGNVLTFSGSYPDGSGTTTETVTLTVTSGNPMSFSGSGSWSWTGSYTCKGSDSYYGYKL